LPTTNTLNKLNATKHYDAVIFDFDGVIVDTEKYHFEAWNKVLAQYGIQCTQDEYENLKSTGREYVIEYFNNKFNLNWNTVEKTSITNLKGKIYNEIINTLSKKDLLPFVLDYLDFLKSNYIKIGIASSSKAVKEQIACLGLTNYFDVIIDGNDVQKKKPHPEVFLKTAEKLNTTPDRCLVFEDAPAGIEAGIAGGFEVIHIGTPQSRLAPTIPTFKPLL